VEIGRASVAGDDGEGRDLETFTNVDDIATSFPVSDHFGEKRHFDALDMASRTHHVEPVEVPGDMEVGMAAGIIRDSRGRLAKHDGVA
jgi:hypothetical protein